MGDSITFSLSRSVNCQTKIFPSDVLKWMKINVEPLMAIKLMKVCKYFQHKKFPYFVVTTISNNDDGSWNYNILGKSETNKTNTLDIFANKSLLLTEDLYLYQNVDPFSSFLSKIAICKAQKIYFKSQNLTIDEFKTLSKDTVFKFVNFYNTTITYINGELIALENLLQVIPYVTYLSFDQIVPSIASTENATNIKVPHLTIFEAHRVQETFDFQKFTEFMKSHPNVQCRITYDNNNILSPKYIQQLEEYINKLGQENSIEYPPPVIHFPGQQSQNILNDLHRRYDKQIHNE